MCTHILIMQFAILYGFEMGDIIIGLFNHLVIVSTNFLR